MLEATPSLRNLELNFWFFPDVTFRSMLDHFLTRRQSSTFGFEVRHNSRSVAKAKVRNGLVSRTFGKSPTWGFRDQLDWLVLDSLDCFGIVNGEPVIEDLLESLESALLATKVRAHPQSWFADMS